jgi:hypothetical protein
MKVWRTCAKRMPDHLVDACLDYKKWKRLSSSKHMLQAFEHRDDFRDLLRDELLSDCAQVDAKLARYMPVRESGVVSFVTQLIRNLGSFWCVEKTEDDHVGTDVLFAFVQLNKETLYKICKRLDRVYAAKGMCFLKEVHGVYKFIFQGGMMYTRLQLELGQHTTECPICLTTIEEAREESGDKWQLFVLDCGHIMCMDCFRATYKIKGMRGTLFNLLDVSAYRARKEGVVLSCPMCRKNNPWKTMCSMSVWPPDDTVLKSILHE